MERLTTRNYDSESRIDSVYVKDHDYIEAAHKLAAYEDAEEQGRLVVDVIRCSECQSKGYSDAAYKVFGYVCNSALSPCRKRIVAQDDYCAYGRREAALSRSAQPEQHSEKRD